MCKLHKSGVLAGIVEASELGSIPQSNDTRWLSDYRLIAGYLAKEKGKIDEALQKLNSTLQPKKNKLQPLTDAEQDSLNDAMRILNPLQRAIVNSQNASAVTVSSVVPTILSLYSLWKGVLDAKKRD